LPQAISTDSEQQTRKGAPPLLSSNLKFLSAVGGAGNRFLPHPAHVTLSSRGRQACFRLQAQQQDQLEHSMASDHSAWLPIPWSKHEAWPPAGRPQPGATRAVAALVAASCPNPRKFRNLRGRRLVTVGQGPEDRVSARPASDRTAKAGQTAFVALMPLSAASAAESACAFPCQVDSDHDAGLAVDAGITRGESARATGRLAQARA
jgi:hypothetical protein